MNLEKELIIKLNNNFYLDKESYQVLRMLYKPLISASALNIYLSIYELAQNKSTISSLLLRDVISSNISLDKIEQKLDILKEYKLIKYSSSSIELYPPLNKEEFKKNNLLVLLKNITSKEELDYLINKIYKDEIEILDIETKSITSKLKYKEIKKGKVPYSFNELKEHVSNKELDSLKDTLDSLASLYNYSLEDILKVIYEADENDVITKEALIETAYKRYLIKNNLNKEKNDNNDLDALSYFKEYNPEKALAYGGRRISKSDTETLKRLKEETSLSDELISLLVVYSLVTNNYKMHAYRFYEVIYEDWQAHKIETLDEAYHYINNLYSSNNKNSKKAESSKSSEDWFADMWAKLKEEQNDRK